MAKNDLSNKSSAIRPYSPAKKRKHVVSRAILPAKKGKGKLIKRFGSEWILKPWNLKKTYATPVLPSISTATLQRQSLDTLYKIMGIVTNDSLSLETALQQITDQLLNVMTSYGHPPTFVYVALLDRRNVLHLRAASGADNLKRIAHRKVDYIDANPASVKALGLSGEAVQQRQTQSVSVVQTGTDYLLCNPTTRSALAVPILLDQQESEVIGTLNLEFEIPRAFTKDDILYFEQMAHFIAVELRKRQHRETVFEVNKTIFGCMERDREAWLYEVLKVVVEKTHFYKGRESITGAALQTYDVTAGLLTIEATYPGDPHQMGSEFDLNKNPPSKHPFGNSINVIASRRVQYLPDIASDSSYFMGGSPVRSELDMPLQQKKEVLGILTLTSDKADAFDENDIKTIELVAEMIVIALENRRLKDLMTRKLTLAGLGLASSNWRYEVSSKAVNIRNEIDLLNLRLENIQSTEEELSTGFSDSLKRIRILAQEVVLAPVIPILEASDDNTKINLLQFVKARLLALEARLGKLSSEIHVEVEAALDVRANPQWLGYALDNLLETMGPDLTSHRQRSLFIFFRQFGKQQIEVEVKSDKRIPASVVSILHKQMTSEKPSVEARYSPLLVSQAIIEAYGGSLKVNNAGKEGTSLIFWMPALHEKPKQTLHKSLSERTSGPLS